MLLIVPHAGADAILPHRRATVDRTTALLVSLADALVAAGKLPPRDYRLTATGLTGAGVELLSAISCRDGQQASFRSASASLVWGNERCGAARLAARATG
jgi:hypothetical protein